MILLDLKIFNVNYDRIIKIRVGNVLFIVMIFFLSNKTVIFLQLVIYNQLNIWFTQT